MQDGWGSLPVIPEHKRWNRILWAHWPARLSVSSGFSWGSLPQHVSQRAIKEDIDIDLKATCASAHACTYTRKKRRREGNIQNNYYQVFFCQLKNRLVYYNKWYHYQDLTDWVNRFFSKFRLSQERVEWSWEPWMVRVSEAGKELPQSSWLSVWWVFFVQPKKVNSKAALGLFTSLESS